jgi:hypothetical protein
MTIECFPIIIKQMNNNLSCVKRKPYLYQKIIFSFSKKIILRYSQWYVMFFLWINFYQIFYINIFHTNINNIVKKCHILDYLLKIC